MNNNSTRLPLLPSHHFALSLSTKQKWESFWKSIQRIVLVFKMDLFNDSDNEVWFSGFCTDDTMLREAVADSEFNVNEVSSVHIADWSNWQQWWLGWRYHDRDGWSPWMRQIGDWFAVRTRVNTDFDVADAGKLGFFYRLLTPEMFCSNSCASKPVCSRNNRSSTKPALQEVNKQPSCVQILVLSCQCRLPTRVQKGRISRSSTHGALLLEEMFCGLRARRTFADLCRQNKVAQVRLCN